MAAHTPGPWAIEYPLGDDVHVIVQADKPTYEWAFIATITEDTDEGSNRIPPEVARANAQLIRSAPDLLAELSELVSMFNQDKARFTENANLAQRQVLDRARAALANAHEATQGPRS